MGGGATLRRKHWNASRVTVEIFERVRVTMGLETRNETPATVRCYYLERGKQVTFELGAT